MPNEASRPHHFSFIFKRHRSINLAASEYDVSLSLSVRNAHLSPVIGRRGRLIGHITAGLRFSDGTCEILTCDWLKYVQVPSEIKTPF